jgi:hypothetical protein
MDKVVNMAEAEIKWFVDAKSTLQTVLTDILKKRETKRLSF